MFSGGGVQKHSIYPISGLELESECTVATVDWRSRQTRCHQLAITWRVIAQTNKWPFPVSKCHSERNHTKSYIYRDRTEKLPLIHIFIIQLPLCIIILIYLIHLYKSDYNFTGNQWFWEFQMILFEVKVTLWTIRAIYGDNESKTGSCLSEIDSLLSDNSILPVMMCWLGMYRAILHRNLRLEDLPLIQ